MAIENLKKLYEKLKRTILLRQALGMYDIKKPDKVKRGTVYSSPTDFHYSF
jgi:hypothetical protein